MVVFAGIAVLCLGALVMRYLRRKKCDQCPSEPSPDTLKITVSYCPNDVSDSGSTSVGDNIIQDMHDKFVDNDVSQTN